METISLNITNLEQTLRASNEVLTEIQNKVTLNSTQQQEIVGDDTLEKNTVSIGSNNLREKDKNICEEIDVEQSNKEKSEISKADITNLGRLIQELVHEKTQLLELSYNINKNDQPKNTENPQMTAGGSVDDQENQDPKSEKEASNGVATKIVHNHKSSKARLSLLTQQVRTLPESNINKQGITEKTEEYNLTIEEDSSSSKKESNKSQQLVPLTQSKSSQPSSSSPRFQDILDISRTYVNFAQNLPGQISEETLEIVNRSNENIVVQIIVDCHNTELQDTDEYVYSIRRTHLYDYNDKHLLLMSPFSTAAFKLALKVPNRRLKESVKGTATFTIQGLSKSTKVPLDAAVIIPKLNSPKELYHIAFKCNVITLALKSGKKQENKIPIKNNSKIAVTLDLDFFKPKPVDNEVINEPFDCFCFPAAVSIPANGMGIVGILIKPKNLMVTAENEKKHRLVKKVLLGKCRESSLIYSFVLLIESHN